MNQISVLAAGTAAFCLLTTPVLAQSQGDWTVGFGVSNVNPKSNNGTLAGGTVVADVEDATALTFTAEYFIRDNLGIELLVATPFEHDINLNGAFAATADQLPPTLSLNYHFQTAGTIKPYAGIGLNYTTFFDESTPGGTISLDDSFGLAVQLGVDFAINDRGAMRLNARWIDIESDVTLNGTDVGEVDIDPIILTLAYVRRF